MDRWDDGFPPPSRPIRVEGGIRVRSKRGAIGESWWSRRFLGVLESFGIGGRISRGKSYARAGQVLDLRIVAGAVVATVQGSRSSPYRTRVETRPIRSEQWARLERELAGQALFGAKLLAGEMPHDIDEVFRGEGLSLFPALSGDLDMSCSCPDPTTPCKHLAATLYVFAEALDDDPFLLLAWRGRGKDDLLANLRALRGGAGDDGGREERDSTDLSHVLTGEHVALSESTGEFWTSPAPAEEGESGPADAAEPDVDARPRDGVLRHLGRPDVELRGHNLADLLRPAYRALTSQRSDQP